jgi:hypothetical protein
MRSQKATVTRVIHPSLVFKGIVVEAENPASITNQSDESLLSGIGIEVRSLQEVLDAYFAPFQGGEKLPHKFMQPLPKILITYLQRR